MTLLLLLSVVHLPCGNGPQTPTHTHVGPHQPFGSCNSPCKFKWCEILYLFISYFSPPPLDSDMMKCEIRWPSGGCGQGSRPSVSTTPMHSNGPPTSGQLCNNWPITWRDEAAAQVFRSAAAEQAEPNGGVCRMCNAVDETNRHVHLNSVTQLNVFAYFLEEGNHILGGLLISMRFASTTKL